MIVWKSIYLVITLILILPNLKYLQELQSLCSKRQQLFGYALSTVCSDANRLLCLDTHCLLGVQIRIVYCDFRYALSTVSSGGQVVHNGLTLACREVTNFSG